MQVLPAAVISAVQKRVPEVVGQELQLHLGIIHEHTRLWPQALPKMGAVEFRATCSGGSVCIVTEDGINPIY